jgi:hypothetical protein
MKNRKIIFASILGIVLILFFILSKYWNFREQYYLTNVLQCTLFDKNFIFVEGENIDINKITIELNNDLQQGIVFKNGKKVKRIKNEYGFESFKIFYDSLLIAQAGIFKTNWWHTHSYFFDVIKKDSTFDFNFKVKGPDSEGLHYSIFTMDKPNKTLTAIGYDENGKTGYIRIEYYDDNGNVIVDEGWENDTLIILNLHKEGNWYKNYNINYSWETTTYKLIKEPHNDSLKYIFQTIEDGEIANEIINVKK